MNKNLLYVLITVLIGCNVQEKKPPTIFFAGEIINPTSKYVVLYKDDAVIDSSFLDTNNRFSFKLDNALEGLYHFDHTPELQYVYLQQGDSLMARLNTSDFDESLVFSGVGEEINNFLLEMFLVYEQERLLINSYYGFSPEEFSLKIDSLRNEKLNLLNDLMAEIKFSEKATEIATANIDYNYYTFFEEYPFKHRRKKGKKSIEKLPSNFYDYRNQLNFNNKSLTYFRPYYNFMKYHFGNLSFMSCANKCETHPNSIKNQLHFNKHKLKLIDSMVIEKNLRDNLFRFVAMDYLLNIHDNDKNNEVFINEFHKLSDNNKHISEIDELYKGIKKLQPNHKIPNITLYDSEGKRAYLQEISKEKTVVFYFWSGTQKRHFSNVTRRITYLNEKNPDYTFYGINLNTDTERWLAMVDSQKLDRSKQYRAANFDELTSTLILDKLNKAIITKDGVIVDAFANLYTSF